MARRAADQVDNECVNCAKKRYATFKVCPHCGFDPRIKATPAEVEKRFERVIKRPARQEGA